jgi:hypothetical protein
LCHDAGFTDVFGGERHDLRAVNDVTVHLGTSLRESDRVGA